MGKWRREKGRWVLGKGEKGFGQRVEREGRKVLERERAPVTRDGDVDVEVERVVVVVKAKPLSIFG